MTRTKYYIVDIDEGEPIRDDKGKIIYYSSHAKAEKANRNLWGTIIPVNDVPDEPEVSVEPASTGRGVVRSDSQLLKDLYEELLAEANAVIGSDPPDGEEHNARLAMEMLKGLARRRHTVYSITAAIVTEVAANKLYLVHPPTQNFPNRMESLRDFLVEAGISPQSGFFYQLLQWGEVVVPFLQQHEIDAADYIAPGDAAKTMAGSYALARAVNEGEPPSAVEAMLQEFRRASGRRAVQEMTRRSTQEPGRGGVLKGEEHTIIVLVMPHARVTQTKRLMRDTDWDLTLVDTERGPDRAMGVTILGYYD